MKWTIATANPLPLSSWWQLIPETNFWLTLFARLVIWIRGAPLGKQFFCLQSRPWIQTCGWNTKHTEWWQRPTVQLAFMLCKYPDQIQTHRGQLLENSTKLNYIAIKMFYIVSTFRWKLFWDWTSDVLITGVLLPHICRAVMTGTGHSGEV